MILTPENSHNLRLITTSLFLFFLNVNSIHGQTSENSAIVPAPDPFSLDAISAIQCIDLLKNNPFLELKDKTGKTSILTVRTVWSVYVGMDDRFPPGFRSRYNIIVNKSPLDWDHCFIEYGGEMINLRILFTYRNQYPPPGLEYRDNP